MIWDLPPKSCPWARRARPHAAAMHGRDIASTKVKALPESLGNSALLESLCVHARRCRGERVWRCRCSAAVSCRTLDAATSPTSRGLLRIGAGADRVYALSDGPRPLGAAAWLARRDASNTELAALPAAADWPKLKKL